jgi:hypothetical protein
MTSKSNQSYRTKEMLRNLRSAGAVVEVLDGGSLYSVHDVVYGDEAWCIYRDWAIEEAYDPRVGAGFFPSEAIINSVICPSLELAHQIQVEASSLTMQYSTLRAQDFADGNVPVIGGPILAPQMITKVRHQAIAVTKLMEAMS